MSTAVLQVSAVFPAGTTVEAHPLSHWGGPGPPAGAPEGAASASQVVAADGSLHLSGLSSATVYRTWAPAIPKLGPQFMAQDAAPAPGGAFDLRTLLRYGRPQQTDITYVDVPVGGITLGSSGSPEFGPNDHVVLRGPGKPIEGPVRGYGAFSVHALGLEFLPGSGIGNYVFVWQQCKGHYFLEGLGSEDLSAGQPDMISVCGDWSGSTQGFAPSVILQNLRGMRIRADNTTNHADLFQPQGVVGYIYADKVTCESNYDVFTVAVDSCNGVPPKAMFFDRINTWWGAPNAVSPFTAPFWLNSTFGDGTANGDTMPVPTVFGADVWVDTERGDGRDFAGKIENAIYPHGSGSSGKAGGGTLRAPPASGNSPFAANEVIGAADAPDHSYCTVPNPKMLVRGKLWKGSPPLDRPDVTADLDGLGSFVAPNIGLGYESPGYLLTPEVDFAL